MVISDIILAPARNLGECVVPHYSDGGIDLYHRRDMVFLSYDRQTDGNESCRTMDDCVSARCFADPVSSKCEMRPFLVDKRSPLYHSLWDYADVYGVVIALVGKRTISFSHRYDLGNELSGRRGLSGGCAGCSLDISSDISCMAGEKMEQKKNTLSYYTIVVGDDWLCGECVSTWQ